MSAHEHIAPVLYLEPFRQRRALRAAARYRPAPQDDSCCGCHRPVSVDERAWVAMVDGVARIAHGACGPGALFGVAP